MLSAASCSVCIVETSACTTPIIFVFGLKHAKQPNYPMLLVFVAAPFLVEKVLKRPTFQIPKSGDKLSGIELFSGQNGN